MSALLRGITSNIVGNFYCLNCLHTYRTKDKLKKHENVCKNYDYCNVDMPNKDNRILKYNHGKKSIKVQFIIYADLKFLLEKMRTHHNSSEKSSTTKINKHILFGYSLFTKCSFNATKNELHYYRSKNCTKNFCPDLKEHATEIINYEKKK